MRHLFFTVLLFSTLFVSAQNNVKSTDKYVEQVTSFLKQNVLVKKELAEKSPLGGAVTGYYLKNKLQLITAKQSGEFDFIEYFFYVEKDSLLYAIERKVTLKEPISEKEYAEYEKYVLFNTKDGNTDLKKWPLTLDIRNSYYFQNRRIVKYELSNFGKPLKAGENEIETSTTGLVNRYLTHLEELKH